MAPTTNGMFCRSVFTRDYILQHTYTHHSNGIFQVYMVLHVPGLASCLLDFQSTGQISPHPSFSQSVSQSVSQSKGICIAPPTNSGRRRLTTKRGYFTHLH